MFEITKISLISKFQSVAYTFVICIQLFFAFVNRVRLFLVKKLITIRFWFT